MNEESFKRQQLGPDDSQPAQLRPNRKARRREKAFMRAYVKALVKIRNYVQGPDNELTKEPNLLNWAYQAYQAKRIVKHQARMFGCKV